MGHSIHAASDREADEYELKLQRKLMGRCFAVLAVCIPTALYTTLNPLFGIPLWIAVAGTSKQVVKHSKRIKELRATLNTEATS